jgi:hypothetical protein
LTLEKYVITAQMNFCRFAGGLQLLQVPVAQFALLVLLITDSLGVSDSLGDR